MDCRMHGFASLLCSFFIVFTIVEVPKYSNGYIWPKKNTYTTRWDKVNLDEILDSKRLLQHYFNCLMAKGPCPPDGQELRKKNHKYSKLKMAITNSLGVLPEALATGCAKCTQSQLDGGIKVIRYLREFEPEKFNILASKYDPEGIYRQRYLEIPADNNAA